MKNILGENPKTNLAAGLTFVLLVAIALSPPEYQTKLIALQGALSAYGFLSAKDNTP